MTVLMFGWVVMGACTSRDPVVEAAPEDAIAFPEALLDATWVVALATEQSLGPFASEPGWVSLVMKRDVAAASRQLGARGGLPAARAHVDASAMFRQAALISAHSLVEVYSETSAVTDPLGAAHLVTVGRILRGEVDEARQAAATYDGSETDPAWAWHLPWKAWLEAGAVWPPDLSGLPMALPEPEAGQWPSIPESPHYTLPERTAEGRRARTSRTMGDPGALVALALWHDAAALSAAGDRVAELQTYRSGYRLPVEGPVTPAAELPLELLFGSDLLVPGDGAFLADLHGPAGLDAIATHADRSLLAWIAQASSVDGRIEVDRVVDLAAALRTELVERTKVQTGGEPQGHHRQFADIATVGTLRSLALVAEVDGDREASGSLRINAYERSAKATACPVGLLSFAAWDASNRYPMRALDILHGQASRYPSLEVARAALDVLGLRVSHERTGETPGM